MTKQFVIRPNHLNAGHFDILERHTEADAKKIDGGPQKVDLNGWQYIKIGSALNIPGAEKFITAIITHRKTEEFYFDEFGKPEG